MAASALSLTDQFPALQVVVPLMGALATAVMPNGRLAWAIAAASTVACGVIAFMLVQLAHAPGAEPISYALGGWAPPWGIEYRVDRLSSFVLLLVAGVATAMMPFALNSVESEIEEKKQAWFYTMYLLCLCGLLGIVITGDAFNAFVFLEVSSLSTYAMIALGRHRRALLSAYQYLIMGTIGATFYVLGIGFLYTMTGTLNMADLSVRLVDIGFAPPVLAALAFLLVGLGLKLALFPLHNWLPGAYAYAPSFTTVFLAATATKVAVYLIVRYFFSVFPNAVAFNELPLTEILLVLGLMGVFGASIVALFQNDLKRMLAYSSVSQIGYIMLGVGLANADGLTGGLAHLFNHAVTKAALFLAVGCVVYHLGTCQLEDLNGLGRQMPLTMAVFVIGALSIIGAPGTAGFISKWYLALGALDKGWWWLVIAIMISSFISVIYMGRVIEIAYFRAPDASRDRAADNGASASAPLPIMMSIPLVVFAAATIYFGLQLEYSADLARSATDFLLGAATEPEGGQ